MPETDACCRYVYIVCIRHMRVPIEPMKIDGSWGKPLHFSIIMLMNIRENEALILEIGFIH